MGPGLFIKDGAYNLVLNTTRTTTTIPTLRMARDFINNTPFANGADYNMLGIAPDGSPLNLGNLRDNIAYQGRLTVHTEGLDMANNSWTLPAPVTAADFEDVSAAGWDAPRQADGSLPVLRSFQLRPGSALAGMGAFH